MIPKVIHYCWFGMNPKTKLAENCIRSWKKYCPDYEIIEWNEDNYDISKAPLYVRQAYEARKWAFVTDYVRLWIIYEHGGIYLDTDVKVIRSWDELLKHDFFIGRQPGFQANTGAGFGAVAKHPILKIMMDDYQNIPFIKEDGTFDLLTCPTRNSRYLFEHGLNYEDTYQEIEGVTIYPIEYFSPKDAYTREVKKTKNTYSIHLCGGSWSENATKWNYIKNYIKYKYNNLCHLIVHIPNRFLKIFLGKERYECLKQRHKK